MTEVSANPVTMSTIQLREFINAARLRYGEKEIENSHFLKRVEDELDGELEGVEKFSTLAPTSGGKQKMKAYVLTLEQAMLVGMRESKGVRRQVLAKLKQLEQQSSAQSSQPQPAVGSKAWQYEREAGKVQRLSLTDTIRDYLIPLATEQGSSSPKMLYQVYSQMINRVLGYPAGQRDVMAVADLNRLEAAEEFAAQQIITLSLANLHYKKVFELVKAAVVRFAGSLPVLRPVRLALN